MRESFEAAESDLKKTMALKPSFLDAYKNYLELAKNGSGELSEKDILALVLQQNPSAYYFRWRFLDAQRPRWGGSHQLLRHYALQAQEHRLVNHRLYGLLGFEYQTKAEKAKSQGKQSAEDKDSLSTNS